MPYILTRARLKKITKGMKIVRDGKKRTIRNYYFGFYNKERGLMYAVFEGPVLIEARDITGRRIRRTRYAGETKPIKTDKNGKKH